MFLPPALMMISFLRSTMRRKPSSSSSPMSPVWSQPSPSIVSRGLRGLVAIAAHHDRAAHQHLAVAAEPQLHARHRDTDGADLRAPARIRGRDARQLRHPPDLGDRDVDRVEELQHVARRRRGAGEVRPRPVEAERRAQRREHELLGARAPGRERLGHRLAGLLEPHPQQARLDRALDRRALAPAARPRTWPRARP